MATERVEVPTVEGGFAVTFDEIARYRRLATVIWNQLGLTDPDAVSDWINGARAELLEHRESQDREPWRP